jgi:cobalt-zinc-cadmium efflux system outer membrane protein
MKTIYLVLVCTASLGLGAAGCTVCAQQAPVPAMPGTNMPPQQTRPAKPASKPEPNRTKQPPDAMPGDMQSMGADFGDSRAKSAAESERNSVDQQGSQADTKPAASGDATSLTVPVEQLQEPEALDFHTGRDLPTAELLREVVSREPMTVETFLDLADRSNPTLMQAQRNVERSRQQGRQASLPPDPTVGYSGDQIRGGSYHGGEQGAFIAQVFVLGRKLALRRDIYLAEGRSNQFAVEVQRARIHDDVARGFFHTLAAQEAVVIHDRLLKVALDGETNAHELERVGQADASDVLSAEIAAEQAKADFEDAQRMFLASFAQLATYAGQRSLTPHPLSGGLVEPPVLDAEGMVATDTQESPYTKRAEADVAVAEERLKDAKRESLPNLNIKAGERYSGEDLGATNSTTGWESFAEAGVQLPLWNRNQGNTQAAKAEVDRAHENVTRTELWTRNQAEPYAQQYLSARATADRYRTEMLPRGRRAYQLEVMKYQQMAQSYPHVLNAQHMLFTLQLSYIQALDREWQAAIALEDYALMDGLDQPISTGDDSTTLNLPTGGNE